jgi:translation elongation factor EF-1beta
LLIIREAGYCSDYVFLFVLAAKLAPVGFGINKLQIMCVVEDDKVSVDFLIEEIQKFEHLVQSVDIVAFNKI